MFPDLKLINLVLPMGKTKALAVHLITHHFIGMRLFCSQVPVYNSGPAQFSLSSSRKQLIVKTFTFLGQSSYSHFKPSSNCTHHLLISWISPISLINFRVSSNDHISEIIKNSFLLLLLVTKWEWEQLCNDTTHFNMLFHNNSFGGGIFLWELR